MNTISTDKAKLDVPLIHSFLTTSYWAKGRTLETVKASIKGSLCFGVYHGDAQVGFSRPAQPEKLMRRKAVAAFPLE